MPRKMLINVGRGIREDWTHNMQQSAMHKKSCQSRKEEEREKKSLDPSKRHAEKEAAKVRMRKKGEVDSLDPSKRHA